VLKPADIAAIQPLETDEKGTGRSRSPFENPSQGDNPNITLTRPQNIRLLTLVGE
jgi:hypothetical protein